MTKAGYVAFERARKRLAAYVGRSAKSVSDADTIEFLARGVADTLYYLRETDQLVSEEIDVW